jgi:hypothetical protein
LSGQFGFPRNRGGKETRDTGKVGLFEVFWSRAGQQSRLIDRFHPEAAGTWIAANAILVRGKETHRLDEGSAQAARPRATLRTNVAEIVPIVMDFNVLASRADTMEPALHPGIAASVDSAPRNSGAGLNAPTCHYFCAGSIFSNSQAGVAIKLESTFIVPPTAAISDDLEMDGVHRKTVGRDDSRS